MMTGAVTVEMTAADTSSRRESDRLDVELAISLGSESNFFTGFSENISEGGLFVATHDYKGIGSRMTIQFSIPDGDSPIDVECVVRWVREYNPSLPDMIPGMGLQFLDLSPLDEDRIQCFCDRLREPMFVDLDFM